MEGLNPVGVAAAMATFGGVWLGHVAVRYLEFKARDIRPVMLVFIAVGFTFFVLSAISFNPVASAVCGILGITCLWDALECVRQQKRVRLGHAPANPDNPRHAQILAESSSATTEDLLAREPQAY